MYFFINSERSILGRAELTELGSGKFILMGTGLPVQLWSNDVVMRDNNFYNNNSVWMGDYLTSKGDLIEGAEDLVEMLYGNDFRDEWVFLHNFWRNNIDVFPEGKSDD